MHACMLAVPGERPPGFQAPRRSFVRTISFSNSLVYGLVALNAVVCPAAQKRFRYLCWPEVSVRQNSTEIYGGSALTALRSA